MEFLTGLLLFGAGVLCGCALVGPKCFGTIANTFREIRDDLEPERRRAGRA
jgi:hypothetical protein